MVTRLDRHPAAWAWLPVALLPPLLVLDAALSSDGPGVTVLGVLAAVVGCLPLVVRSRLPFRALAPLLTAGIILVLWQLRPGNTVVLIPMVALVELAKRGDRRASIWAGLAVLPCVVVSVVPFAHGTAETVSIVVRNVALCLLALAVGDILRWREEAALRRLSEERLRIAREVHDVVAHAMVAINVQAGVAAHLLDGDTEQARAALREIKATSGVALADLRATLGVLREGDDGAQLGPALGLDDVGDLAAGLRAAGVAVDLEIDSALAGVPSVVHAAGYRIVQEALTNVLRHSGASAVRVRVAHDDDCVEIEVADDGHGEPAGAPAGAGHGVRGMRERAQALNGTLEAGPAPGGGWRVRAHLPTRSGRVGAPA